MKLIGNEVFLFTVGDSENGEKIITIVPGRIDHRDHHIKTILSEDVSSLEIGLHICPLGFVFIPTFNIVKSGKTALDLDTLVDSTNYLRKIHRSLAGLKRRGIRTAGDRLQYLAEDLCFLSFYRSGDTKLPKSIKECVHMTGEETSQFVNQLIKEFTDDRVKS